MPARHERVRAQLCRSGSQRTRSSQTHMRRSSAYRLRVHHEAASACRVAKKRCNPTGTTGDGSHQPANTTTRACMVAHRYKNNHNRGGAVTHRRRTMTNNTQQKERAHNSPSKRPRVLALKRTRRNTNLGTHACHARRTPTPGAVAAWAHKTQGLAGAKVEPSAQERVLLDHGPNRNRSREL